MLARNAWLARTHPKDPTAVWIAFQGSSAPLGLPNAVVASLDSTALTQELVATNAPVASIATQTATPVWTAKLVDIALPMLQSARAAMLVVTALRD